MLKIKTALISVSDKDGIVGFAKDLSDLGIQIISTGGTARLLKGNNINVTEVSQHTGFPEIMDGRVKTLHPKIHAGILALRDNNRHLDEMDRLDIKGIDLVVVNLYPFEKVVKKADATPDEIIENIDIGGSSMIRSAAKNYKFVAVVVNPGRYKIIVEEMRLRDCSLTEEYRLQLAKEAFSLTWRYDRIIADYFEGLQKISGPGRSQPLEGAKACPEILTLEFEKRQELRYGENPHQSASFYVEKAIREPCITNADKLSGKELSYNNIVDLNAAWEIVSEFDRPTAVVIKHTNPCGASSASRLADAFLMAYRADPVSAFGCVLGFNKKVDLETAENITAPGHFVEAIIAPDYDGEAIDLLINKRKWGGALRILKTGSIKSLQAAIPDTPFAFGNRQSAITVVGGLLVQDRDLIIYNEGELRCVTNKAPSEGEMLDLRFAFTICKHVKSNSIVLARDQMSIGIGAGQMSRIDAVEIAIKKAGERAKGSVMASDAFFPFRDSIDIAGKAGVTAIIQPGGSNRDNEVIAAANEYNISMVFTGIRHFKH